MEHLVNDYCYNDLVPAFVEGGLPIGLLINGKPFAEDVILRAGYAFEQATDWKDKQPDLSWAA